MVAALLSACSKPPTPVTPDPVAKQLPPVAVVGEWTWVWDSTIDGVVRAETEQWTITGDPENPTRLSASMLRTVVFQVQSGPPFRCNQSRKFSLTTRFVFEGTRGPEDAELKETERNRLPSPCASTSDANNPSGPGNIITVALRPTRGGLDAEIGGKVQALRAADFGPDPRPIGLVGEWRWRGTSDAGGQVVEVDEIWTLERHDTELAGRVVRRLVLSSKDGSPLGCVDEPTATYTEMYSIIGRVEARSVTLVETARVSAPHPCSQGEAVHLDTATGLLFPQHIELRWRGNRRQVLKRVQASPTP